MRQFGEDLPFGHGHFLGLGLVRVEQAFEHDPTIGDVVVDRQVDPAHAAVGERPADLVLVGHQIAGPQLGVG